MIVFKCDRCGAIFGTGLNDDTKKRGDIWPGNTVLNVDGKVYVQGDFCAKCTAAITQFLRETA